MIKSAAFLLAAGVAFSPAIVSASPTDKIKSLISVSKRDDGTEGKCIGNKVLGKCMEYQKRNYLTYPGKIQVNETQSGGGASKGEIVYKFACRMRKKNFIPEGGPETATSDSQHPGAVKANYLYVFNELSIKNMRREGGTGRCAAVIMERMNDF